MFPVDLPLFSPIKTSGGFRCRYRLVASSAATVAELEAAEALVLLWNLHQVQLQQLQALFPENVEPWDLLMILMWMMEFDG